MLVRSLALTGLLSLASAAQAAVIFQDNFNADLRGRNKTTFVGGWTVGDGTVDVIGAGPGNEPGAGPGQVGDATNQNYFPANGNFLELDGSSMDAGIFRRGLALAFGMTYTAVFQLAGSQQDFTESVDVDFGSTEASYTLDRFATFTTYSLIFTPGSSGTYFLSFGEPGMSNNQGLLLDNVRVSGELIGTAVPEPASWALALAALAACGGGTARRRRTLPASSR